MAITYTLIDDAGGLLQIIGNELRTKTSTLAVGVHPYRIRAEDSNGWTKEYTGNFVVTAQIIPVKISGTMAPTAVNQAYSFTPTVSDGAGAKSFTLGGSLPSGLSFSQTTGAITGTPTNTSTSPLTITVTDSTGSASLNVTLRILVGLNNLTITNTQFVYGSVAGTYIGDIVGVTPGSTLSLPSGEDRFVLTRVDANTAKLYVGLNQMTVPSVNLIINETYVDALPTGRDSTIPITTTLLQNVASRGQVHTGTVTTSGTKNRFKGMSRYTIGAGGAATLSPIFANYYLNASASREVNGASYSLVKASVQYEGVTVPLRFAGQRAISINSGSLIQADPLLPSAFGVEYFKENVAFFVKMMFDLPSGAVVSALIDPMYLTGESQLRYDPVNDVDDIDQTTWTVPTGSDTWVSFPSPVMVLGKPYRAVSSIVGVGDSILNGVIDAPGDGLNSGGWGRRSTFSAALPYLSVTKSGDKAEYIAQANTKSLELIKRSGAVGAIVALGNNDIRDGRTSTQVLDNLRSIWTSLRSAGVQRIANSLILSETTGNSQATNLVDQTVKTNFGAGSPQQTVNDTISSLDSGRIDDYIDIVSPVQSQYKWNVPSFTSSLTSDFVAGNNVLVMSNAPLVGDHLTVDADNTNRDSNFPHVVSVTGSGPYTVTLSGPLFKNHAIGAVVKTSFSSDMIHPQMKAHQLIASKSSAVVQRMKDLKEIWIDNTKSFQVDFPNNRAQVLGKTSSITSFITSSRSTVGKAFDGISYFDIPANKLRYVDGGGLIVEDTKTNEVRNSSGSGTATTVTNWIFNNANGITASVVQRGIENGLEFVDIRLTGTTTSAGGFSMELETSIPVSAGDTHSLSFYLAHVGGNYNNINGFRVVARGGASGGGSTEFLNGPLYKNDLSRDMKRFSNIAAFVNGGTIGYNTRLAFEIFNNVTVDFTFRVSSPQAEKGVFVTSPIRTTGSKDTRSADNVTIALPSGVHDVFFTLASGAVHRVDGVSGVMSIPNTMLNNTIRTIHGVSSAYKTVTDTNGYVITDANNSRIMEK